MPRKEDRCRPVSIAVSVVKRASHSIENILKKSAVRRGVKVASLKLMKKLAFSEVRAFSLCASVRSNSVK